MERFLRSRIIELWFDMTFEKDKSAKILFEIIEFFYEAASFQIYQLTPPKK